MKRELLIKFLNDNCDPEELNEVIQWARSDSFHRESRKLILEDWSSFDGDSKTPDEEMFSSMLHKIHHKINISGTQGQDKRNKNRYLVSWLTRAAAILLIPVLSVLLYILIERPVMSDYYSGITVDTIEISSPPGSTTVFKLTDGTVVHLNSESIIKYPQNFSGNFRNVYLSGEAYFDVAYNPEKPFVVSTDQLEIKALGTEFNVMAFPDEDFIATTLVEGKVLIMKINRNGKETIGQMIPNQHLNLNTNSGKVTTHSGDIKKYIAWKDGKLVFDNSPLSWVAKRLGQMYNVDIKISEKVKDYTLTVTFVDESLTQILDLMTIAAPVEYKSIPRKKLPDGTFSKQKIIIESRD